MFSEKPAASVTDDNEDYGNDEQGPGPTPKKENEQFMDHWTSTIKKWNPWLNTVLSEPLEQTVYWGM